MTALYNRIAREFSEDLEFVLIGLIEDETDPLMRDLMVAKTHRLLDAYPGDAAHIDEEFKWWWSENTPQR